MILLDTHVLWWLLDTPERLGPRTLALLSAHPSFASSLSLTELLIKTMVGKFVLPPDFTERVSEQGPSWLSYTASHAASLDRIPELVRHDPFDRMLLAQAYAERIDFLTADRLLLALDHDWIVDARA
ncbi:MAG: type II toxin-antitoxin system VapC family toxin [Nocardioides sp.]